MRPRGPAAPASPPANGWMSARTARSVALEVIGRVIDDGAYSNRLLPALLARSGLDMRDRAFATELAFGTLRRRLVLDAEIERVANRPLDKVTPPEARNALRLGAYQLPPRVAPHAAVWATVDLVPGRARGFVNAVLRRLGGIAATAAGRDRTRRVAVRTGLRPGRSRSSSGWWARKPRRSCRRPGVARAAAVTSRGRNLTTSWRSRTRWARRASR